MDDIEKKFATNQVADPDPHKFELQDPDPHSNCGSGSRRAKITHKNRKSRVSDLRAGLRQTSEEIME